MNTRANFNFNQHYHIYNRTNNKEKLFLNNENRSYFLKRYKFYLGPFLHIHAYALMRNHFHFCIKVKSQKDIETYLYQLPKTEHTVAIGRYLGSHEKESAINNLIIGQHHRFFISYAQAFNKMYNRKGNLFYKNFKKSVFDPYNKFKYLQYYIHHNARKHKVVVDFKAYKWTSYHEILNNDSKLIDIDFVINHFGNLNAFKEFHEGMHFEDKFQGIIIE